MGCWASVGRAKRVSLRLLRRCSRCSAVSIASAEWDARLARCLFLRLLRRFSRSSGVSEARRALSRSFLRRNLFSLASLSIFANWSRVIHDFNHTRVSRVNVPAGIYKHCYKTLVGYTRRGLASLAPIILLHDIKKPVSATHQ